MCEHGYAHATEHQWILKTALDVSSGFWETGLRFLQQAPLLSGHSGPGLASVPFLSCKRLCSGSKAEIDRKCPSLNLCTELQIKTFLFSLYCLSLPLFASQHLNLVPGLVTRAIDHRPAPLRYWSFWCPDPTV